MSYYQYDAIYAKIMRILIVEDEEKLAKIVKDGLTKQGYAVDHVADGQKAQLRIQVSHNEYDVIVLDLMLPKLSGLEICKSIRKLGIATPVLVLTANDDTESKVTLFD